jgi:hypothetical protein
MDSSLVVAAKTMPAVDDFPYRAAATLAIDLIRENPAIDDRAAIDLAWRVCKSESPTQFHEERYAAEVVRIMQEIRSGHANRIELSPATWEKALERLRQSEPPARRR